MPPTASRSARIAATLLAILLPVVLVWAWLWAIAPAQEGQLNEYAQGIRTEMEDCEQEVLLVGSSLVGRGVDEAELARAFQMEEEQVHTLWRSATLPPHWYLMLKNHVFSQGCKPRVVIIASTMRRFHQWWLATDGHQTRLTELLGEYDPVVATKVYGREQADSTLGLLRSRRSQFRDALLDRYKAWVVALLFAPPGPGRLQDGASLAEEALTRVFAAEEAKDMSLYQRVVPIVETVLDRDARQDQSLDLERSLVPDLAELVERQGSRLILVQLPVAPSRSEYHRAEPALERALIRRLNERGVGYVDLSQLPLQRKHFLDLAHLGEEGRKLATDALVEVLRERRYLSTEPLQPLEIGLGLLPAPQLRRTGSPPQLPRPEPKADKGCTWSLRLKEFGFLSAAGLNRAGIGRATPVRVALDGQPLAPFGNLRKLRDDCGGGSTFPNNSIFFAPAVASEQPPDAAPALSAEFPMDSPSGAVFWLYPGTTIAVEYPETETLLGQEITVSVAIVPVGPGEERPQLLAAGMKIPLLERGELLVAQQQITLSSEALNLQLISPEEAPYALLESLQLASDGSVRQVVGEGYEEAGRVVVQALNRTGRYAPQVEAPPSVPAGPHTIKRASKIDGVGRLHVPELEFIADNEVRAATLRRASPLRIAEDGVPLPTPNAPCYQVNHSQEGRYCHLRDRLLLTSADGSAPYENGRIYSLSFAEDRFVQGGWWIYPQDRMVVELPSWRTVLLGETLHRIELEIFAFAPPASAETPLQLALGMGDEVRLTAAIMPSELDEGRWSLDCDPPIDPRNGELSITLRNPDDSRYWWLKTLSLVRDRRLAGSRHADRPDAQQ